MLSVEQRVDCGQYCFRSIYQSSVDCPDIQHLNFTVNDARSRARQLIGRWRYDNVLKQATHYCMWSSAGRTAIYAFSMVTYKLRELGQADLVLVCDQSSSIILCM